MAISKADRARIKQRFGGHCAYCGCLLGDRFHVDHTDAVYRDKFYAGGMLKPENNVLEKLFPSCIPCNLFKSVFTIEQFRNEIEMQVERARRSSVNFRTAERFGLLQVDVKPVVFFFERFNETTSTEPAISRST